MRSRDRVGVVVLLLAAIALRLHGLDRWSLWLDETLQYSESIGSIANLYVGMHPQESFLSFVICRALIELGFDGDVWLLRLPLMIIGALIVPAVWGMTNELLGRTAAWIAGALACVCPMLIIYSQEYRFYGMFALFCCLALWSLGAALRTNAPAWWAAFAIATLLNLYTHFLALIWTLALGVGAGIWLLVLIAQARPLARERLVSAVGTFAIVGVGYLPGIPWLARFAAGEPIDAVSGGLPLQWATLVRLFGTYTGLGDDGRILLYAGLALIGAIAGLRRRPLPTLMVLISLILPLAVFAVRGGGRMMAYDRYVIFLLVPYLALVGSGAAAIAEVFVTTALPWTARRIAVSTAAAVLGMVLVTAPLAAKVPAIYRTNPKFLPIDLTGAFRAVAERVRPDDLLLEASTPRGGNVNYFSLYEAFYLRPRPWPGAKEVLTIHGLPPRLRDHVKRAGRVHILAEMLPDEAEVMRQAADGAFSFDCYVRICLMSATDRAGATIQKQLRTLVSIPVFATLFQDEMAYRLTVQALNVVEAERKAD